MLIREVGMIKQQSFIALVMKECPERRIDGECNQRGVDDPSGEII